MKMKVRWSQAIPIILAAIGLLLLLPSCTEFIISKVYRPPEAATLGLGSVPWQDGEQVKYRAESWGGTYVGSATFTMVKDAQSWILRHDSETPRVEEHSSLKLKPSTLKPISQEKSTITADGELKLTANFLGDKLGVIANYRPLGQPFIKDDAKVVTVPLPADHYANDQLLMSLRALPFDLNYKASFSAVVPANVTKAPSSVEVVAREEVTTPAGDFDCWKVRLDFGTNGDSSKSQYLWYQVESPHHLVKYDNGDVRFLLEHAGQS